MHSCKNALTAVKLRSDNLIFLRMWMYRNTKNITTQFFFFAQLKATRRDPYVVLYEKYNIWRHTVIASHGGDQMKSL